MASDAITLDPGTTLRVELDSTAWNSTIAADPAITATRPRSSMMRRLGAIMSAERSNVVRYVAVPLKYLSSGSDGLG